MARLHAVFDRLGAFVGTQDGGIDLQVVEAVGMHSIELGTGLAESPVPARALALFQHFQRAADGDEPGRKIGKQGGAVNEPGRLDQDVIGDDVMAGAGRGGDGPVHGSDQAVPGLPGGGGQPQHIVPQGTVQVTVGHGPDELVDTKIQVGLVKEVLDGTEHAGFARARRAVEDDDIARRRHDLSPWPAGAPATACR